MDNYKEYQEYMPNLPDVSPDSEKKGQNKVIWIIIAVVIVLIVIFGLLFGFGVIDLSENGEDSAVAIETSKTSDLTVSSADSENGKESNGSTHFTTVQFPVFSDSDLFDYDGEVNDCGDEIVWITTTVAPTRAILTATLDKMFNPDRELGFTPNEYGNVAAMQEDLSVSEVKIDRGVAKVYLIGEVTDLDDDCDSSRLLLQITTAAMQFDTVDSVEVYLEGELL